MKYCRPEVRDYGNLVAITADGAGLAHLGFGTLAAVSSPLLPSSSGSGVAGDAASVPAAGDGLGGVAGDAGGDAGVTPVAGTGGAAGSGGSGGSGGGSLPFTGLPAAAVAAVGAGLSAAGLAVRKYLSRD